VRYVFFLDDDVEPNEDYFSNCIDIFEKNPSIECLGGFDPLAQPPKSGLLATAFFLGSNPEGGKVLKSGIATTAIPQSELTIVEWVPGGMQSFRAELVANNRFDARIRIHGDDVEFQTRICKPGAIATSSRLPVTHFSETLNKDSIKDETAYMDGFRLRLAREKRSGVTRWAVLYSTLALLIFTLLVGLSTGNKSRLSQTLGHAEFLRRWLLGKEVEQRVS
jgi:GT2 family glycosyltransferase